MKFDVLYNFISPVSGRVLADEDYVLVGDDRGIAIPSATIPFSALPNLTYKKIWVGDPDNRPVEADYPDSGAPADATYILQTSNAGLPNAQALINLFIFPPILTRQILMSSPLGVVSLATEDVDYASVASVVLAQTTADNALAAAVAAAAVAATALGLASDAVDRLNNLRLNNIPVDGNISLYNEDTELSYRIVNAADPVDPQDLTTKFYVDNAISGVPGTVTINLIGAVSGSGISTSPISTTLNTTLNAVPLAVADVNINTHKLTNVTDPTSAQDASTKNYVDTRSISLSGGVTGSGTLATGAISTTVASVSPSVITGYPSTADKFLRGDGTWTNILSGNLGLGGATPASALQFPDTANNRIITLNSGSNNSHQFYGFGINANVLRYQVTATTADHVWYAGIASNASNELFRVKGNGLVTVPNVAGAQLQVLPLTSSTSTGTGCALFAGGVGILGTLNSGVVAAGNGAVGTPSHTFTSDTTTGLYRIGAGNIGVSCSNTKVLDVQTSAVASISPVSIGRLKGSVGISKLELYGASGNANGPHIQCVVDVDNYPLFQLLPWTHDGVSLNFDAYYNGTNWLSSSSNSNFQIIKTSSQLQFNYATGFAQGATVTWNTGMLLSSAGLSLNTNKIINLGNPANPQDAVTLSYLNGVISGIPGSLTVTLSGAVSGSGVITSTISTTLNTTLNAVPLAVADVNINTHKLTNVTDPTSAQDASTKNYVDTRSISLSGGVTGSGTLATGAISTTVASVSPSVITGYPSTADKFLRGDGTWTNILSGNLGLGNGISSTPIRLTIKGQDQSYTNGAIIELYTDFDNYPLFQLYGQQHNGISLSFDTYFNGINWISSNSINNVILIKSIPSISLFYSRGVTAGDPILSLTPLITMATNGSNAGCIGIGMTSPNAPIQFDNPIRSRKIVLCEYSNNDNQTTSIGTGPSTDGDFRLQIAGVTNIYSFYAGVDANTSNEVFRVKGSGGIDLINNNITNVTDPTSAQDASTKNYVDTRSISLSGEVTGSGTLATGTISTTVASVSPSVITGYPSTADKFLRGDGTWTNILSGNLGLGGATPASALQFPDTANNRIITLNSGSNNSHQFYGFGYNTNVLRYQVTATTADHVWYAGTSSSTSNELFRVKGTGVVTVPNVTGAQLSVLPTTVSTTTGTGCAIFAGGVGIAGTLNSGVVAAGNGVVGTPSHTFTSDTTTGLYLIGAGNIGVSCSNTKVLDIQTSAVASISPVSIGRLKGSVGVSKLELYGTTNNPNGPHIQCIASVDNFPLFQLLPWAHGNISLNFDAYYNGTNWISSSSNGNFQIVKTSSQLQFNYASVTQGGSFTWNTALLINTSGNIGIGIAPSYRLDVSGTTRTQKLVGNGNAPIAVGGAAAGVSPVSSCTGTELSGTFNLTTGTSATSGIIANFTLFTAMPAAIYGILFFPANSTTAAANLQVWAASTSTTTFTLTTQNALASLTTYQWNYHIIG